MKQRNVIKMLLYAILSVGMYYVYWFYVTAGEMRAKGARMPRIYFLLLPGAASLCILFNGLLYSLVANKVFHRALEILAYLLGFVLILSLPFAIWWLWRYCQGIESITKGKLRANLAFGLFWGLSVFGFAALWPLIIQDYYNRSATRIPEHYKKGYLKKHEPFRS